MGETIGFIGLGVMGKPMARNLLKKGFAVVVCSRTRADVDALAAAGATAADSPAAVARACDRVITMLPDSPDVTAVLEGPDGVFSAVRRDAVLIDMSSISPAVTRRLAARAETLGATLLDAPVSGGEIGAINGTLSIMVGGRRDAFDRVKPILDAMGNPERVIYIGESGAGQTCKVCNQMVIGGTLAAVGEAFALARKAGVDPARVREALLGGFAASRVLEVHGERILQGNYKPGFRTKLYAKDLRLASETVAAHQAFAPVTAIVQQIVNALMAGGRGEADYAAVGAILAELSGSPAPDSETVPSR
jgi:2-hydroxy-3-oxopropionate reductase